MPSKRASCDIHAALQVLALGDYSVQGRADARRLSGLRKLLGTGCAALPSCHLRVFCPPCHSFSDLTPSPSPSAYLAPTLVSGYRIGRLPRVASLVQGIQCNTSAVGTQF